MFKAMFFRQTPMDSSRHFIMPSSVLWLRHFATPWNNVADCLICLFAHSTKRWCPIFLYRRFPVVSLESLLLCRCYQTFCFSLKGTSLQPHLTLLWSYLFRLSFKLAMHDLFWPCLISFLLFCSVSPADPLSHYFHHIFQRSLNVLL